MINSKAKSKESISENKTAVVILALFLLLHFISYRKNDLISKIPSQSHQLKAEGDTIVDFPSQNLEVGGYGKINSEEQT